MSQHFKTTSATFSFIACCLLACSSTDGVTRGPGDPDADSGEPDAGDPDSSKPDDAGAEGDGPDAAVPDINDPNNAKKDTDCDGLSDAEEFTTAYADGLKTDPGVSDTDGDGLLDGIELGRTSSVDPACAFVGDQDTASQTSPVLADSDGDGLSDGVEDANQDGARDPSETDPNLADTDGDSLVDGTEDGNANGVVDANETDPLLSDTDGDGIPDNIEVASCLNPRSSDTDGDGIEDGIEDTNRNGVVDPPELNPCDPSDGAAGTPAGSVCTTDNLRSVAFVSQPETDLQVALPLGFSEAERRTLELDGTPKGILAWDSTKQVTLIAAEPTPITADSSLADEELRLRSMALPTASPEYQHHFTTWDGYPALTVRYQVSSLLDLNAFTDATAQLLLPGSAGALTASAGTTGPFKLQAEYVRRSDRLLVTWAITPASLYDTSDNAFALLDLAAGSSLARADDTSSIRCDAFTATNGKVDFLFVVDDSGSMASAQQALANTAHAMAEQLTRAALDWRVAMVTTSYVTSSGQNSNVVRGFSSNIHQFRAWLTQNSTCSSNQCTNVTIPSGASPTSCASNQDCWIGLSGNGTERPLACAREAINLLASDGGSESTRFRPDAGVVVVLLTDTRDASAGSVADYREYFAGSGEVAEVSRNPLGRLIPLHGIVCPLDGVTSDTLTWCNTNEDPRNPRHLDIIEANGGVHGSIRSAASIATTVAAIVDNAIAATGQRIGMAPIGPSMRIALEAVTDPAACPSSHDLPRSRQDGFDVDGVEQTISFFGACRPAQPGTTRAAISYRAWSE